jgi:hypothetical protein
LPAVQRDQIAIARRAFLLQLGEERQKLNFAGYLEALDNNLIKK